MLEVPCCNLSDNQTFIIDCRVTPRRAASLSRESIIHIGKSTLTLFCACKGLLALVRSKLLVISLPSSNFLSRLLAFIQIYLFYSRPSDRNYSNVVISISNDSGPMYWSNSPDDNKSRFILSFSRDLQKIWVIPKRLSLNKVYSVFFLILSTFFRVKFKLIHGIKNIP